jgi:adenine-specific DNA-methyltransferase
MIKKRIAFFPTPNEIVKIMLKTTDFTNKIILETGFGNGSFINELKNEDYKKLFGIELDSKFFIEVSENVKFFNNIELINEDYLNFNFKNKFDIIIGNPPYITNDNLNIDIKNKIKELTGSGEGNIYYSFIIQSILNLNNNGELIYILPYDFFYNTYAKKLRQFMIDNGSFEYIIDLSELNIFKNASPDTIIFKWIKNINNNKIKVYKNINKTKYEDSIKFLNLILESSTTNNYFSYLEIEQFRNSDIWNLTNLKKYYKNIKLNSISKTNVGIVSGNEDFFNINEDFFNILNIKERKLIKNFIKSKNIFDYVVNNIENNKYIFYKNEEFSNIDDFNEFPNIKNYLLNNRDELEKRYISGNKKWFHYSAIRNIKFMEENKNNFKIVFPNITRKQNKWFSLTNKDYLISSDVLFIVGNTEENTLFLFGFLNSSYFEEYYKNYGAKKGNRILFNHNIINNIEIPNFEEIIVNKIIEEVKFMILNNDYNFKKINFLIQSEIASKEEKNL